MIIWCKLHGTGILCSCSCPHKSGHYIPLNLQQGKCYSLFCSFVYLYECKCVCYIFKGQSPENGLFSVFQAVGNTLLQKVQSQHDSAQFNRSNTEAYLFFPFTGCFVLFCFVFSPVVIYRCESWIIKKAEHQRIDAFKFWCWIRLLRVLWTGRKSNQSVLKEINPEYSLEGLILKLKLQYFGHLMRRGDHWNRP